MTTSYRNNSNTKHDKIFQLRLNTNLRIVAIGDSSVYGVGDIGENSQDQGYGWAARFAHDLSAKRFINLGTNGARANDVITKQLSAALAMRPDIALLCVGGNDVLRNNFNPTSVALSMLKIVEEFENIGTYVVILGLHDPSKVTPAPSAIKKVLMQRVLQINVAINWVGIKTNAFILETINRENIYQKSNWHIDRMHPSPKGHQLIADILRREMSLPRRAKFKLPIINEESNKSNTFWLITNAFKWLARRSLDLFPALIFLVLSDLFKSGSRSVEYALRLKIFIEHILIEIFEENLVKVRSSTQSARLQEFKFEFAKFTESKTKI